MTDPTPDGAVAWIHPENLDRLQKGWSAVVYGPAWMERERPSLSGAIALIPAASLDALRGELGAAKSEVARLTQLVTGGKGGLPAGAIAWLDMGRGEASITFSKKFDSNRTSKKRSMELFQKVPAGYWPLYLAPQSELVAETKLAAVGALVDTWRDEAAGTWGESPEHATLQRCSDTLKDTLIAEAGTGDNDNSEES